RSLALDRRLRRRRPGRQVQAGNIHLEDEAGSQGKAVELQLVAVDLDAGLQVHPVELGRQDWKMRRQGKQKRHQSRNRIPPPTGETWRVRGAPSGTACSPPPGSS